jgi:hypothetical protein
MKTPNLTSLRGQALVLGSVVTTLHLVARSVVTSSSGPIEVARSHGWTLLNLLGAGGGILLVIGLGALLPPLVREAGFLGLFGVALVGWFWVVSGVFLNLSAALLMPWLAREAPWMLRPSPDVPVELLVTLVSALLAVCCGTALLAVPFLRRRLEPFWVGIALPGGAALTLVGDLLAPAGPSSSLAMNLFTNLGPVLVALALGALGLRLLLASR